MAIDYRKTAGELVRELGGNENIINVTHCATRLRFILKDESVVDKDRVAKVPGVITTVQAGGQFQVVIGNHVKDAYGFVTQLVSIDEEEAQKSGGQKAGIFTRIVDVISAIFAPFLYTLAACGILGCGVLQKCAVKISPRAEKFKNSTAELIFCMLLLAYSVMLMVSSTYSAFIYMNF